MSAEPIAAEPHAAPLVPRGPRGLPLVGHIFEVGRDALGFLERNATYGDVSAFRLASFPSLLINNSDLIEQVLVKQHDKFIKNRVFWRQLTALLGTGLLTLEDEEWLRHRKLVAPAFATQPLESYAPAMVSIAEKVIGTWEVGQEFNLHRDMMELALRIAGKTLFDADLEEDLPALEEAANWVNEEVVARFTRPVMIPDWVPLPGHRRYLRGVEYVERMVYRILADYRSGRKVPTGFIGLLLSGRDEAGKPMSDKQIRDEIHTMLLAGYETSALNMSWAFHVLGQHRDIQDALAREVREVVGDRAVTHEDLPNLPQVERAIIEIMRLYPPAWAMGREAREDAEIGGYRIAAGTTVILSPWVTQRDPRYFEDPLEFRPDRWKGDFRRKLPRFAYFPFGGGPRICIGNRFAMMEAMMLMATILKRFDVERLDRPLTMQPSITLRPVGGIWVRLHERARS